MVSPRERILLVESDPEMSDLIARQTLMPLGYQVKVVFEASQAIKEAVHYAPDVILTDLNLPDLSGKDLLVALGSQALDVPVVVIAERGLEGDVIQAFRLGAADYLRRPVREAEVVSAVERVLKQVRARREREALARQLNQANQELQRRVRELTTIFAVGKAVTSITNQRELLDKVVEGAVFICEADSGWLLLRDDRGKSYILSACLNLPKSIKAKIGQPWEDGISSLVALSGEALSIHGEPLKRFKVSSLGQSILVVPIKVKREVVGLLVVLRKKPEPFKEASQALLEGVADYASISLVNAHLFKALEERVSKSQIVAENAQLNERIKNDLLADAQEELLCTLDDSRTKLMGLLKQADGNLDQIHKRVLQEVQGQLGLISSTLDSLAVKHKGEKYKPEPVDVNELARHSLARFQKLAHQAGVTLIAELSITPLVVNVPQEQIMRVFDALLSNAVKYNKTGGKVTVRVEKSRESNFNLVHVIVEDTGKGIEKYHLTHIFDRSYKIGKAGEARFGGLGISLALVKDVITARGGKLWVESEPGQGSTFHFTLPQHN
jgi:signal transduction histidine kinase/DNA-binding response OmpR family regulator